MLGNRILLMALVALMAVGCGGRRRGGGDGDDDDDDDDDDVVMDGDGDADVDADGDADGDGDGDADGDGDGDADGDGDGDADGDVDGDADVDADVDGDADADAFCGDHVVDAGEDCDDGNGSNTDACTNDCESAVCGDGWVRNGFEDCDDGNRSNADGCITTCERAFCGDGFVQAGIEECDDLIDADCVDCRLAEQPLCPEEAEVEPNDQMGDAVILCGDGSVVTAMFGDVGDDDWYAVILNSGDTVSLETTDGAGSCLGDTLVFIYSSAATPTAVVTTCGDEAADLSCDDDTGISNCSLLTYVAPADDVYYVRVVEYGDDEMFGYALSVTIQ